MFYVQLNLTSYILLLCVLHAEEVEDRGLREFPNDTQGVRRAWIQTWAGR